MQLVRVTPDIFRQHREALQILTAGPRHALNHCVLTQLRHLGVSMEFVGPGIIDKAIKFRVLSKGRALDSALYAFEELTAGLLDDGLIPGRTGSVWRRNSMTRSTNADAARVLNSGTT
eukprot:7155943-Pyramimonas_sp.AAC.1